MKRLHICAKCGAKFTNDRAQQRYCDTCIHIVVNEQDREIKQLKASLNKYNKVFQGFEEVRKVYKESVK